MIIAVMDDIEAYGQLRERTSERPLATTMASPPVVLAPPRRRRAHWLRNITLIVFAYLAIAAVTLVQPFAVPLTDVRLSALRLPFVCRSVPVAACHRPAHLIVLFLYLNPL